MKSKEFKKWALGIVQEVKDGGMLFFDGKLYPEVKWHISSKCVYFDVRPKYPHKYCNRMRMWLFDCVAFKSSIQRIEYQSRKTAKLRTKL